MEKRVSCRAIILFDDKIAFMHRIKDNGQKHYWVLPGGGLERGETLEQCVIREVVEEFGITVEPIKKLYEIEDNYAFTHFFLAKYISGDFASGVGEEYQRSSEKFGEYLPELISVDNLEKYTIYPVPIKKAMIEDIKNFGFNFDNKVKSYVEI